MSQSSSSLQSMRGADDSTTTVSLSRISSVESTTKVNYYLKWQRSLPDPIMGLRYLDVTGDGLRELAVLSLRGVHVLQVIFVVLFYTFHMYTLCNILYYSVVCIFVCSMTLKRQPEFVPREYNKLLTVNICDKNF